MAFTEEEVTAHLEALEGCFWSKRRPPRHLRDKICEGQRLEGQAIELYFTRPFWRDPSQTVEESIAKISYVRSRDRWKLYWKRSDGKWHGYPEYPEAESLEEALRVIDEDKCGCFFG